MSNLFKYISLNAIATGETQGLSLSKVYGGGQLGSIAVGVDNTIWLNLIGNYWNEGI